MLGGSSGPAGVVHHQLGWGFCTGDVTFEPIQVIYSGNGNRGLTGHSQTGEGGR